MREDPPLEVTVATVVAERQASAGARDGVKAKRNDLGARAPLHALVGRRWWAKPCRHLVHGSKRRHMPRLQLEDAPTDEQRSRLAIARL